MGGYGPPGGGNKAGGGFCSVVALAVPLAAIVATAVACAPVDPPPVPDRNWVYRWSDNPRLLWRCTPQRAVREEQWYLDRSCEIVGEDPDHLTPDERGPIVEPKQ